MVSNLCLAQTIKQTEKNGEPVLIFQIKVSDMGAGIAYPIVKGKNPDDVIEISLPGKLYDSPREVGIISKQDIDRSTPEKAAASFFSANKSGDREWMIENWAPQDHKKIKTFFENTEVFTKNQELFRDIIEGMIILGEASYKEYVFLFVRNNYRNGKAGVPLVQTYVNEDGWRDTNALSADETAFVVGTALRLWDNKWFTQN